MLESVKELFSIGVIAAGLTIIVPIITHILNRVEKSVGKQWRCRYRQSDATKYVYMIVFSTFMIILAPIISIMVYVIVRGGQVINNEITFVMWCGVIVFVAAVVFVNYRNHKRRLYKMKESLLKFECIILNAPIVLAMLAYIGFIIQNEKLLISCFIILVVFEIIGLTKLSNQYIYEYRKAKIITYDNKRISGVNSNSISVKDKWFVIRTLENNFQKEIRISQDRVYKIEYYDKNPDY